MSPAHRSEDGRTRFATTSRPSRTRTATTSTAESRTACTCLPTCRRRAFWSVTLYDTATRSMISEPEQRLGPLIATTSSRPMRTAPSTSTSGPRLPRARRATGSRPFPVKASIRSSVSTAPRRGVRRHVEDAGRRNHWRSQMNCSNYITPRSESIAASGLATLSSLFATSSWAQGRPRRNTPQRFRHRSRRPTR